MKKIKLILLLAFAACFTFSTVKAELPDGSPATDWTLTDLDGNTHTLFDVLNSGKHVVIDFSATWCPPCWSYHNTGVLENLYEEYGPDGTDEIMVYFIEPDPDTNTACLFGPSNCVGGTQGNWVNGTGYPIIDLEGPTLSVASDYQVTYYPTLYGISANGNTVWEVGQATQNEWEDWLFESFELMATANVTDADCPFEGAIDLNISGGYGNLTYNWSNGATTSSISGLAPGTYSCEITDANGYFYETGDIEVGGPANGPLQVSSSQIDDLNCNGDFSGAISVVGNGGNGGLTYNWSNGQSGTSIGNLNGGTYFLTMTDNLGCTNVTSYFVYEPEVLEASLVTLNEECGSGNGELLVFASGGTEPYLYDIGNGQTASSSFGNLTAGSYSVMIEDFNGCTYMENFTIGSEGGPAAQASVSQTLSCLIPEVTVSGTGSATGPDIEYSWTTMDGNIVSGANEIEAVVDAEGTYTLNVTDTGNGCVTTEDVLVEGNFTAPMVSIAPAPALDCNTPTGTVDGSGSTSGANVEYAWSTTNGNITGNTNEPTIDVDQEGEYTLTITNLDTGCSSTESVTVEGSFDPPALMVNEGTITCVEISVELCADVEEGVEVEWTTPAGDVMQGTCITVDIAGSYTAEATGTNGCAATEMAEVVEDTDLPEVSIDEPGELTCTTVTVDLSAAVTGDVNDFEVEWTTVDGEIDSGANTLTPVVSAPGTYTLRVVETATGCESIAETEVQENLNTPGASYSYVIDNGVITLEDNSTGNPTDIMWDFGNGTTGSGTSQSVEYNENGTYTICVTVTNECGDDTFCDDVAYAVALAYEHEKENVLCNGNNDGMIEVTPSGGMPDYTISWEGPNGFTSGEFSLADLEPGEYTMTLNDDFGYEVSASFTIEEPTAMSIQMVNVTNVNCHGDSDGSIEVEVEGGTGEYTYMWSDGSTEPSVSGLPAGEYSCVITDENGCEVATETYEITEPEALSTSVVIEDEVNGAGDGSISLEVLGGTGTYTYEWSNGATTAEITGLTAGEYSCVITDENGCTFTAGPYVVQGVTGIAEQDITKTFSVYPNPTRESLNINAELDKTAASTISVFDAYGKVIESADYNTINIETVLDVSNYAEGVYLLEIATKEGKSVKRFIVIK